jgi:tetratricopeptide (TPR) repeat protein
MKDDYEYGHGDRYFQLLHKQWRSGKNDLRSIEQLATQAQGLLKWKEAIEFWKQMLEIEPGNDNALLNLGHCYASSGEWKEAAEWARKAYEACDTKKEAMLNWAICELKNGRIDTAETLARDMLKKYPEWPLSEGFLGHVLQMKQGEILIGGI